MGKRYSIQAGSNMAQGDPLLEVLVTNNDWGIASAFREFRILPLILINGQIVAKGRVQ